MSEATSNWVGGCEPHLFHPLNRFLRSRSSQRRRIGSQPSTTDNLVSNIQSESPVQRLPLELILEIVSYLSPVAIASWCYTCRYFNQILDLSAINRQVQKYCRDINTYSVADSWQFPYCHPRLLAAHMDLLCLLDRDGKLSTHKAFCYACSNTHDKSVFTPASLDKANTERKCLGVTGRVCICPHFSLSFKQIQNSGFPQTSGQWTIWPL